MMISINRHWCVFCEEVNGVPLAEFGRHMDSQHPGWREGRLTPIPFRHERVHPALNADCRNCSQKTVAALEERCRELENRDDALVIGAQEKRIAELDAEVRCERNLREIETGYANRTIEVESELKAKDVELSRLRMALETISADKSPESFDRDKIYAIAEETLANGAVMTRRIAELKAEVRQAGWCEAHIPTEDSPVCPACELVHLDDQLRAKDADLSRLSSTIDDLSRQLSRRETEALSREQELARLQTALDGLHEVALRILHEDCCVGPTSCAIALHHDLRDALKEAEDALAKEKK
jgi:hypothetical protein